MDFIFGLLKSNGMIVILVIIDKLTKYAYCMPLSHPFGVTVVAKLFMDNFVRLHGWPTNIVSNRDASFMSGFWTDLMKRHGVQLL